MTTTCMKLVELYSNSNDLIRGHIGPSETSSHYPPVGLEEKFHWRSAKHAKMHALGGPARYRDPPVRCLNHPPSPPFLPSSLLQTTETTCCRWTSPSTNQLHLIPQPKYNRDNSTLMRHIPHGASRACQSTDVIMPLQHDCLALPGRRYHCFSLRPRHLKDPNAPIIAWPLYIN